MGLQAGMADGWMTTAQNDQFAETDKTRQVEKMKIFVSFETNEEDSIPPTHFYGDDAFCLRINPLPTLPPLGEGRKKDRLLRR
jgi:hypothetical protein